MATTQGEIGYVLQYAMWQMMQVEGLNTPVVSLITQVIVSEDDPAFKNPTKPIGKYYTSREAKDLQKEKALKGLQAGEDVSNEGTSIILMHGKIHALNILGTEVWKVCDGKTLDEIPNASRCATSSPTAVRKINPTGSSLPNRFWTTVCPSSATRVADRTSESVNGTPSERLQFRTVR